MPGLGRPQTPWGRAFEATFEAAISVVLAMFAGYHADRWLDTEPAFLFLGLIVGGVAAVRRLLKIGSGERAEPSTDEGSPTRDANRGGSRGSDEEDG